MADIFIISQDIYANSYFNLPAAMHIWEITLLEMDFVLYI